MIRHFSNNSIRRAKINGWIAEYEKRIEQYKVKYGEKSFLFRHHNERCQYRIRAWKQEYKLLSEKQDFSEMLGLIISFTTEYFGKSIKGKALRTKTLEEEKHKYYICKFVVDLHVYDGTRAKSFPIPRSTVYLRRDQVTEWIKRNPKNRANYNGYKNHLRGFLEQKLPQSFLDQK